MMYRKRGTALLLTVALLAGTVGGCGRLNHGENGTTPGQEDGSGVSTDTADGGNPAENAEGDSGHTETVLPFRGGLVSNQGAYIEEIDVTPCVAPYTIEPDLSNIDNLWQFYLGDEQREKLAQNGFVVFGDAGREFFEIYEINRYDPVASFVTADSLMHTYHLYFSHLLKKVEKDYLADSLSELSSRMLDNSVKEYEQLKGSEWEEAAKRNVAFFTIGEQLLGAHTEVNDYVKEIVQYEMERITDAEGIETSMITGAMEDYTQYFPRGYYEGDEQLEQYFRAMMWYGRIHFKQENEDLDRSALLISQMLLEDEEAYRLWESIYTVTAFFAGASDDAGVYEYASIIREVYGDNVTVGTLQGDQAAFDRFHSMTTKIAPPQINSLPIWQGQDNVIQGFRFMGQRFTIDGAIMQKLIFSDVKKNSEGDLRMLPDVLDVPAAMGSDAALRILEADGATDYQGYSDNMNRLRSDLAEESSDLWSASLYASWLHTLRPLLEEKGEGYPMFMQSGEWVKKDLECFAGSFTELKHDTVLYSKQVIAEMGGDYAEEADDRGYVEPEPLVYLRFRNLSDRTAQGLKERGMLSADEEENLSRLTEMADRLLEISKKELQDEVLTEEEYEFIRCYGGSIEHFWNETVKDAAAEEGVSTQESPAALVVDIATDPNGEVLEAATEDPSLIYVVVKVDGKLKIAKGSVYSFYQFRWSIEDRLTDSKWRQMMGIQQDEEGYYHFDDDIPVEKPAWTESYRYTYE